MRCMVQERANLNVLRKVPERHLTSSQGGTILPSARCLYGRGFRPAKNHQFDNICWMKVGIIVSFLSVFIYLAMPSIFVMCMCISMRFMP